MKSWLPQKRSDLEMREADDELLVLDRRHGRIHKFNQSAALIFSCCDGRHTLDEIISRVVASYAAPADTVKRDVNETIRSFQELGLLTISSGQGSKT